MITDAEIREQGYIYFLAEAPDLARIIEQEIFGLSEGYSIAKVHNLMRATHTIKGGAATVGLEIIQMIAHSLESAFKALYSPDLVIDNELQTLLLQAYECLRLALTGQMTGSVVNDEEILQRATLVFSQLQEKLGDKFGADTQIPTSEELGFDIVQSIFEVGIKQRLESINKIIKDYQDDAELIDFLRSQAEVFFGLAQSLSLPGFGELAQTILLALQANPVQVQQIAEIALTDLQLAHKAVIAGDRTNGGAPSSSLKNLTKVATNKLSEDTEKNILLDSEEKFYRFLTTSGNNKNECIKPTTAKLYLKVIRYIMGWFNHYREIPESELVFDLLISNQDGESSVNYIESWLEKFLKFVQNKEDSQSLCIYRQGIILIILLAVAKFQYSVNKSENSIPFIKTLQNHISQLAKKYRQYPPVTSWEKNWLDSHKLQKLQSFKNISTASLPDDSLLEAIWGETNNQNIANEIVTNKLEIKNEIDDISSTIKSLALSENLSTDISGDLINYTSNSIIKSHEPIEDKAHLYPSKKSRQRSFIRVDVEGLQSINYQAGELLIHQKRRTLHDEQIQDIIDQLLQRLSRHQETLNQLRDLPLQMQNFTSQYTQNFATVKFDSLEMDVYTEFNLTLHEAIEEMFQLQETTESIDLLLKQAAQISDKKQKLAFSIIDNLVEARMLPLGDILQSFPQMIQKLGHVYKKLVGLKLTGTEVLVDKAIVEKLYDPLLHLVRNAFDHGIEPPQVRQKCGKPEQGLIEICAYHQGSQTIIEVRDDGQGLNFEAIRNKAIELGLISANDEARSYFHNQNESELLNIMFSAGFSTANKVNEISGRGMGLDIVRSQMETLNGSISVQSLPNQGTTFILKMPFSITTDKLMLVQAGGVVYALLLESIEKILIPSTQNIKEFEGNKVLHLNTGNDEVMVSLRQLSELMHYHGLCFSTTNLHDITTNNDTEVVKNPVLLLQRKQGVFALEVDQIIGEQELVIRPLGNAIAPPKYVYGCSSLANGNLILVIDGALLVESHEMPAKLDIRALPTDDSLNNKALPMSGNVVSSTPLLAAANNTEVSSIQSLDRHHKLLKVVLVVDDAISLRQTLSLTLQKSGYQVIQAQNGIEALEQLQRHPEIQVVISDLEMPRMNGFELLGNLHQNPDFAKMPVVILTSRSAEKHRHLAQELGAKAYFTKPYLEHEFISIIEDLFNRKQEKLAQLAMNY